MAPIWKATIYETNHFYKCHPEKHGSTSRGIDGHSATLSKLFLAYFLEGFALNVKEFALGSKLFSFRVDPFSEGARCSGWQTKKKKKNHKSCLPYLKGSKSTI